MKGRRELRPRQCLVSQAIATIMPAPESVVVPRRFTTGSATQDWTGSKLMDEVGRYYNHVDRNYDRKYPGSYWPPCHEGQSKCNSSSAKL